MPVGINQLQGDQARANRLYKELYILSWRLSFEQFSKTIVTDIAAVT